jgi:hypothetical protein
MVNVSLEVSLSTSVRNEIQDVHIGEDRPMKTEKKERGEGGMGVLKSATLT